MVDSGSGWLMVDSGIVGGETNSYKVGGKDLSTITNAQPCRDACYSIN